MRDKDLEMLTIKLALSDIVYRQHSKSSSNINMGIIIAQTVVLILGFIFSLILSESIMWVCCILNIMLCVMCQVNIKVHNKTWEEAKKSLNDVYPLIKGLVYNEDDK